MTRKLANDSVGQSVGNKLCWQDLDMGVGWTGVMEQEEQGSWERGEGQRVCAGEEIKKKGTGMVAHGDFSTVGSEAGGSQGLRN